VEAKATDGKGAQQDDELRVMRSRRGGMSEECERSADACLSSSVRASWAMGQRGWLSRLGIVKAGCGHGAPVAGDVEGEVEGHEGS